MLEAVVTGGTAKSGRLDGYTAAGKTGTAQKIDETGRYSATKYVASFTGFAPATNPAIAMIVMIDEPIGAHHGGEIGAPVFKRIAEQVLRYMSVPPDVPAYAPQYAFKPQRRPAPEKPLPVREPTITLMPAALMSERTEAPEFGDLTIPDFQGKSLRQVTEECLRAGLRLQSIGSGAAVEQMPLPGANVTAGARVQVRFSSRVEGR
jgi:membrane peptidoglycan carboxypeptidase